MTTTLAQRAELLKIARLLDATPESVDYLAVLSATAIRSLRERASATMFDADRRRFIGMANTSRMLPLPILIKIVKLAFGPLLCARVAGLVPPARAIEIAGRLETEFLTEVCLELDPRSAVDMLAQFPVDKVVAVSRELARRDELITMGRFLDLISLPAIDAVMKAIDDDGKLLRIAFFAENTTRLGEITNLLSDERLGRIVRYSATADAETWGAGLTLFAGVDEALTAKLAAITGDFDDEVLAKIVANTQAVHAWNLLLPILAMGKPGQRQRVAAFLATQDDELLAALSQSAEGKDEVKALKTLLAADETLASRVGSLSSGAIPVKAAVKKAARAK